ncbi:hypothetical protein PybrP1_007673 [[Pythium] brassicae (nom. inval.)]|nr:hypothetical protein PybrP1_007673 [[Pythium] brassicae (nom. inval.)]
MVDDETISVKITASKEMEPVLAGGVAGAGDKFTMYTVFVRNVSTDAKTVVRRRYSDFYKLRKQLVELVSWGHCSFCDQYLHQIAHYPFPRRRLLRSSRAAVVKERMDSLRLFLRHLLLCLLHRSFDDCPLAREKVEECILKSFLQLENASALFPGQQQRPIEILQAKEERRQQEQIKAAGLRTHSYGYTALVERQMGNPQAPLARDDRQVDTDTCHMCLQKWTHCYCNEEQDSIYPVSVNPALAQQREMVERALSGHAPYQQPPLAPPYSLQPQQPFADEFPQEYEHRESFSSDASHCSRCDHDWDNCYCCQQVSPTASSVCTDG